MISLIGKNRRSQNKNFRPRQAQIKQVGFTPTPAPTDNVGTGSEFRPLKERRNPKRKDAMGASPWSFTLVELLLVIIIVGILIGLSTPVFKNSYTDFQLSDTASGFASLMRFAQVSAATERARFRINFDTERSRYWLTKATGPNEEDEFLRIQGKFGRTIVSPQKIKIETSQDEITFYPDGRADEVVIYFSSPGNKFYTCLTEGETGYVRLLDYKAE